MHDRTIDGVPTVFGNYGALFMNAMTWYDHDTRSVWSQPWGRAIEGPLKGVELFLLPSQVTSWASWVVEHPETLVMTNDVGRLRSRRQEFRPDFVIGLVLADQARAYYFEDVEAAGVINDDLGGYPVLVWADEDNSHAYLRQVEDRTLTFGLERDRIIDIETGSAWDVSRGLAVEGPLKGALLASVPSMSAFDWAWLDFYPQSLIYSP